MIFTQPIFFAQIFPISQRKIAHIWLWKCGYSGKSTLINLRCGETAGTRGIRYKDEIWIEKASQDCRALQAVTAGSCRVSLPPLQSELQQSTRECIFNLGQVCSGLHQLLPLKCRTRKWRQSVTFYFHQLWYKGGGGPVPRLNTPFLPKKCGPNWTTSLVWLIYRRCRDVMLKDILFHTVIVKPKSKSQWKSQW